MGVYINLTISPENIDASQWEAAYEETPLDSPIMPHAIDGHTRRTRQLRKKEGGYTRRLEHDADKPDQRHWHVVGDFLVV